MDEQPKIEINGVSKVFLSGDEIVRALKETSFAVASGEFLVIVGPSGCGKTTLMRIIGDLDKPTTGDVRLNSRSEDQPVTATVFQERALFPWMTVLDNVAYGLRTRGESRRVAHRIAREFVDKVGLTRFADAYPHQLSGGMKQRVSIARAFAYDPEVLLMDEPLASLDEQTKALVQEELLRVWGETHKTVVYVTHSIDEAVIMGDRIVVFTAHPGEVKDTISVDLPRPRDVIDLKSTQEFAELTSQVWHLLRDEVVRTAGTAALGAVADRTGASGRRR